MWCTLFPDDWNGPLSLSEKTWSTCFFLKLLFALVMVSLAVGGDKCKELNTHLEKWKKKHDFILNISFMLSMILFSAFECSWSWDQVNHQHVLCKLCNINYGYCSRFFFVFLKNTSPSLKSQVDKCQRNLKTVGLCCCVAVLNVCICSYSMYFFTQSGCNQHCETFNFYKYSVSFFILFPINKIRTDVEKFYLFNISLCK